MEIKNKQFIRILGAQVVGYLVKLETGEFETVTFEEFTSKYRSVSAEREEPAPRVEVMPTPKPQPETPAPQAPAEWQDSESGMVCTQCQQEYRRGEGSRDGLLCPSCTLVKCPRCKQAMPKDEAVRFGFCRDCR